MIFAKDFLNVNASPSSKLKNFVVKTPVLNPTNSIYCLTLLWGDIDIWKDKNLSYKHFSKQAAINGLHYFILFTQISQYISITNRHHKDM